MDGCVIEPTTSLDVLEYRLAPLTLAVLLVVFVGASLCWVSWRGEESNGTAIRNLVLVMAAIAALPLAIWRSKMAERQAATAQHQSETAQRGLLNERYQKGAEMMGSSVVAWIIPKDALSSCFSTQGIT